MPKAATARLKAREDEYAHDTDDAGRRRGDCDVPGHAHRADVWTGFKDEMHDLKIGAGTTAVPAGQLFLLPPLVDGHPRPLYTMLAQRGWAGPGD
ncbi:hypothetical protein [Qipengyuania sediminis]|uniref:hypothetical protein n=1 Tax=Qipengyuania sediminis TaxID=1532023 RepID=UPI00105952F2|nr:hypothetical protein [Qipengyuania sediminis]